MDQIEKMQPDLSSNERRSFGSIRRSFKIWLTALWAESTRIEKVGYVGGLLLMISGFFHATILLGSGGSWTGPLSLRKPTTFGLSFGLTLLTLIWVSAFIPLGHRVKAWLLGVFTLACITETSLVSLQAWRGVPSHFNLETTFDAVIARGLAAGGLVLIVVIAIFTGTSFRSNPRVPLSLRIAIRVGFVALFGSQLIGAGMIARGLMLVLAGDQQTAYATGGLLKPIHAVTMHGVLVLPALARMLSYSPWDERRRTQIVGIAAGFYIVVIGIVAAWTAYAIFAR